MNATERSIAPAAEGILRKYYPVLDHGFVSLIDYMGTDADVEQAARVSYTFGTRVVSQTRGLIRYLRRHAHTTPTEMVELKFHCALPIFVARQWIRHRTASVNELSARYSLMPLLFYTPEQEDFQHQSKSNNQGREGGAPLEVYREAVERWERLRRHSSDTYGWLLHEDVARELARIDLPVSIYTQWYWKLDLHNLFHFLSLRVDSHAQLEFRRFANVMAAMVKRVAPLSFEAWLDYDFHGRKFSKADRKVISQLIQTREDGSIASTEQVLKPEHLKECGLSEREVVELREKLRPPIDVDFELDLSKMRTAAEIGREMQEAVPGAFE